MRGKHSEETKLKMSISAKRRDPSTIKGKFEKGHTCGMTGKHHSQETLQKMRKVAKGRIPWLKGKHHTIETRKKMSEIRSGKLGSNWRGGITPINNTIRKSLEYKLWRTAVFERDKYTCRFCLQRGGKLQADHIKPFATYPELRFAIDNGRTLCVDCHKTTETYGKKAKK
jgi:hypothetical protein